jgi:predicted ATPase/DNA-binding SARP family transcriptional activator
MQYRVLGPLEVRDGEESLPLAGAKQRALLALLLLHANRVLSRDRLIDELWGDEPPATAVTSLQVYVSRLRKVLPADRLLTRPPGYVLEVEPDELDLRRFERLLAEGHEALAADDAERAAIVLHQALELWRGPALAEFAFEPFAQAEIGRLEDLRLAAVEERIEADLALGRHADLIGELEALIAENPHRERLRGQLILALYRSGRQAEALQAYQAARRALDDLGIEPSEELQRLEKAMLTHDSALETAAIESPRNPTNLPVQPWPLVGRERELADLLELLEANSLVTLTGGGGSGKTRLALEAAAQLVDSFPDGVWFVSLAAVREAALVEPTIAQVLGARDELREFLSGKQLLLILDNLEQLLPDVAPVVAAFEANVLATSRERLNVSAEQEYAVPTLPLDDGVALFTQRARQLRPAFEPDENAAKIVRRLDGLPLAIELAAARVNVLSASAILERLDKRLRLLTGGARDAPKRQRTLRATFDWSYELLTTEERGPFARLAVFTGGCTLAGAEQVCATELDTLASLVDKGLVLHRGDRYLMLETIREYALERLTESGEINDVRRRHAQYFLARAESLSDVIVDALQAHHAAPPPAKHDRSEKLDELGVRRIGQFAGLGGGAVGERLGADGGPQRLTQSSRARESRLRSEAELELANFRSGLEWCIENGLADWSLRFVAALSWPWLRLDSAIEGRTFAERALGLPGEVDLRVRARALEAAGALTTYANDLDRASQLLTESLGLFRQLDDRFWIGVVLDGLADLDIAAGRLGAARARYEECLGLFSELANDHGIAAAQFGLAVTQRDLGETQAARPLLASAVRTFWELHDLPAVAASSQSLGDLELEDWNLDDATRCYTQSLSIARDAELPRLDIARCLGGLAAVAASRGDIQRAGRLWGAVETFEASWGIKLLSPDRGRYELRISRVTGAAFDAAVTIGRRLTLREATAYALSPN